MTLPVRRTRMQVLSYGRHAWVVLIAVAALVPLFTTGYLLFQLQLIFLYIAAAAGSNIAVGYAGELLLCQAAVIGVGAYAAGILALSAGWSPWATLPVSLVAAVGWQLLISVSGLRVRGLYLGLLSFFSILAFADVVVVFHGITGGEPGLVGVPSFVQPGAPGSLSVPYEVCVGVLAVSMLFVALLVRSGWGTRFRALRDSPNALQACGVSISTTKLVSYVAAALPGGLAGWALAFVNQSVNTTLFGVSLTLVIFAGVQLVAPGTLLGPVIGTGILAGYSQLVGPFSEYNTMGLGLLLAAVVILIPSGIAPRSLRRRRRQPGEPPASGWSGTKAPEQPHPALTRIAGDGLALEVTGVSRSFGGNHAVRDVSFRAERGRVLALVGDNGSGKTTLVNLISGLLRPDTGAISVLGTPTVGVGAVGSARAGCSRTFQTPQLIGRSSVLENVEVGAMARNCSNPVVATLRPMHARKIDQRRRAIARAACAEVGFAEADLHRRIDELPVGLRRLVEVARCVATGAGVVCLDEPSVGLNNDELEELVSTLRLLRESGRSVLLVEHNVDFILDTADDVMLMRDGSIVGFFAEVSRDAMPSALAQHLRQEAVPT